MTTVQKARRASSMRPLLTRDLRPKETTPVSQIPAIVRLSAKTTDMIVDTYASFGCHGPRALIVGVNDRRMDDTQDGTKWLKLDSPAGSLRMSILLDRSGVLALCEGALGGSGAELPVELDGTDRPLSRIETTIRDEWLSRLESHLVASLSTVLGMPFSRQQAELLEEEEDLNKFQDATVFDFTIDLYGLTGRLLVAMCRNDLRQMLSGAGSRRGTMPATEDGRVALTHKLAEADGEIEVAFQPEAVMVQDILNLRPGALLRLSARMTSPVVVSSSGHPIFTGSLEAATDRLAVKLRAPTI